MTKQEEIIITDQFHIQYYNSHQQTWANTKWLGIPAQKCPFDLWTYQEILYELRPDIIIECGTAEGGSTLFLASICDLINHGSVITIDVLPPEGKPAHNRVTYLHGSSVSVEIVEKVKSMIGSSDKVMVILDSDHSKQHVLCEIETYGPLVSLNHYLIVEDTNINGNPVLPSFGAGPMEAVKEYLNKNSDFVSDRDRENHYLTFNPNGYLRRIK